MLDGKDKDNFTGLEEHSTELMLKEISRRKGITRINIPEYQQLKVKFGAKHGDKQTVTLNSPTNIIFWDDNNLSGNF